MNFGQLFKDLRLKSLQELEKINFVEEYNSDDLIFNFDDVSVFIDPSSFKFLKGTKVDFLVEGVNEGIKFLNPNVKAVCGCGESFQVDI